MATGGGISKTNYSILKQYVGAPTASDGTTVNGVSIPTGILPINGAYFTNYYSAVGSIDYNMSNEDQIRGRYIWDRVDQLDNLANLPTFWTNLPSRYDLVAISEYHAFGPKLNNEFRIGYNRYSNNFIVGNQKFSGLDQFPNIQIDSDLGIQVGPETNAPQSAFQNTYQFAEDLNWVVGSHDLKFGADIRDSISPQYFIQRSRGDYAPITTCRNT